MVAVNRAHTEVVAGAAQLGFPGVRLTPLADLGKELNAGVQSRWKFR